MTMTENKVVRTGRVTLKVSGAPERHQSFLAEQYADGEIRYYLGSAARTSDGMVTLEAEHHDKVVWKKHKAQLESSINKLTHERDWFLTTDHPDAHTFTPTRTPSRTTRASPWSAATGRNRVETPASRRAKRGWLIAGSCGAATCRQTFSSTSSAIAKEWTKA